jgi:hypothetical protein
MALPSLPHTWRPLGPRIVSAVLLVGLFGVCAVAWFGFDAETRAKFTPFQIGTLFTIGLGVVVLVHALTRSRVTATRERLVVVNGYRKRTFEWAEVLAVSMPPGAPWVTLDLADGTSVAAMGIPGSDGGRAHAAVRQLRALAGQLG